MKSLLCTKNHIQMKYFGDCSSLNFIDKSDLYSLFGNAIDNAIEAVNKTDNKDLRTINLIVRPIHSLVSIRVENYFSGEIKLDNAGLPITTKKDKDYHGYGIKSIMYIAKKYNGDVRINVDNENHIFSLSILLPLN